MPDLNDVFKATYFAVESAIVCDAGPRLEDSTPAGVLESHFGRPVTKSQITAAQGDSVPINTKHWAVNVWRNWLSTGSRHA